MIVGLGFGATGLDKQNGDGYDKEKLCLCSWSSGLVPADAYRASNVDMRLCVLPVLDVYTLWSGTQTRGEHDSLYPLRWESSFLHDVKDGGDISRDCLK